MSTEVRPRACERGFTLIEVLIAMVLLAISLMALVPLGVVAVRQTGLADRNTRSAAQAAEYLETALSQLREHSLDSNLPLPAQLCLTLPNGDVVSRRVRTAGNDPATSARLPRVEVTVTPEPRGSTPRPLTANSSLFVPNGITDSPNGTPCP